MAHSLDLETLGVEKQKIKKVFMLLEKKFSN